MLKGRYPANSGHSALVQLTGAGHLTDRGAEYCGKPDTHNYQLFLALNNIDHTKTKAKHSQANGICERFHKTVLREFYSIALKKKIYLSLEELQIDLNGWIDRYNTQRPHQRKRYLGRTPMETFLESLSAAKNKILKQF